MKRNDRGEECIVLLYLVSIWNHIKPDQPGHLNLLSQEFVRNTVKIEKEGKEWKAKNEDDYKLKIIIP